MMGLWEESTGSIVSSGGGGGPTCTQYHMHGSLLQNIHCTHTHAHAHAYTHMHAHMYVHKHIQVPNLLLFIHKHFQSLFVHKKVVNIYKLRTNKQTNKQHLRTHTRTHTSTQTQTSPNFCNRKDWHIHAPNTKPLACRLERKACIWEHFHVSHSQCQHNGIHCLSTPAASPPETASVCKQWTIHTHQHSRLAKDAQQSSALGHSRGQATLKHTSTVPFHSLLHDTLPTSSLSVLPISMSSTPVLRTSRRREREERRGMEREGRGREGEGGKKGEGGKERGREREARREKEVS